jgi:hypothetical protein
LQEHSLSAALSALDADYCKIPGYDVVADGAYWAAVEDVSVDLPHSSSNPRIVWKLRILHSDYFGRQLRRTLVVDKDSLRWLKRDLYVCGVALESLQDLPGRLENLLNLKALVKKDSRSVHILRVDSPVSAQGRLFLHLIDGTGTEYLDQQLRAGDFPRITEEFEAVIDFFVRKYKCPQPTRAFLEDATTGEILFSTEPSKA